jgi:RNA polymerase sigma-70 factor (ECF subfamily)
LWQEGTDLRAWLLTILHNQYVNEVRRSVREGMAVPVEDMASVLPIKENATDSLQLRDLHRAMGRLPEEQRQAILLVGLEGMSYEQAALILNVPLGTVRSRLSRGRETLRVLMAGNSLPACAPGDAEFVRKSRAARGPFDYRVKGRCGAK